MVTLSKRGKFIGWTVLAVVLMAATIPLAIWVTHTQTAQETNAQRRCANAVTKPVNHKVTIQNDTATPAHTTAALCDTLTITNLDNKARVMAFGQHEHHISYDGVSERILTEGQSLTVQLVKAGTYPFHDHTQDSVQGDFTVGSTPPPTL